MTAALDIAPLARRLLDAGLMDTPFREMSKDQVLDMIMAIREVVSLPEKEQAMPFLKVLHGEKVLVIPSNAPDELQPHKSLNGRLTLHRVLRLLNASDAAMRRYLGDDYELGMVKEMGFEGHCPLCGEVQEYRKELVQSGIITKKRI